MPTASRPTAGQKPMGGRQPRRTAQATTTPSRNSQIRASGEPSIRPENGSEVPGISPVCRYLTHSSSAHITPTISAARVSSTGTLRRSSGRITAGNTA